MGMDLETMSKKIASHKYHSRQEFVDDMRLIFTNSLTFNGEFHEVTTRAKFLLDTVEDTLVPFADHCEPLEANIREAQKRALEQADLDSLGTSFTEEHEPRRKKKRRIDAPGSSGMSPNEDTGDLLDDLQYSSEEDDDDDWDEVEDSDYGAVPPTPIYNIQQGANGELYAEPDPSMSFHPSQGGDYMETSYNIDYSIPVEDAGYSVEDQVDENYDPTEFFSGIGAVGGDHNGQANGDNSDRLQDDLAVSDDSDDEKEREDDPMAF